MKILINTSNLYVGGGLQVALSFLHELRRLSTNHEYHIFISNAVDLQIDQGVFPSNFQFYLIEKSPSSLKTRKIIVKRLDKLEKQIDPDIVFSVFGPSYWRPKAKHIMGFADGWVYNPDSVAYSKLSFIKRLRMRLQCKYKAFYIKKDADYYVLETKDAKRKLSKVVGLDEKNIFVVGNTYSSVFNEDRYIQKENEFYLKLPAKEKTEFRLMYIAHNHPAKNLTIINDILPLLDGYNIKFVLTIDDVEFNTIFTNKKNIINLGAIPQKSCPSIYDQCDALFAPTLLETFSASYPESMKMELPILTSNYSFAKDVCGESALYFDPLNPKDIAEKILTLVSDKLLQKELVIKGSARVKTFETARSRAEKYIALCGTIHQNRRK